MIFNLSLLAEPKNGHTLLPFNYHYPLSSAIHAIISRSSTEFAKFLHDVGYGHERFKLFTFSDLRIPFTPRGDRMLLLSSTGSLRIGFHIPAAAQHFAKGVFQNERITIRDEVSGVDFKIKQVEHYSYELPEINMDSVTVIVQPLSPIVVTGHRQSVMEHPQYLSPYEKCFIDRLIASWLQKYKVASQCSDEELDIARQKTKADILFFREPVAERRTTIKDGTAQAQKIKGYTKFRLKLTAPTEMIRLALNTGLGVKNSLGMGCLQLID